MRLGALCARAFGVAALAAGCSTAGNTWINEPFEPIDHSENANDVTPASDLEGATRPIGSPVHARTLGGNAPPESSSEAATPGAVSVSLAGGSSLGVFRNTYYDFPSEADYDGPTVALPNARCGTIASVPREFF